MERYDSYLSKFAAISKQKDPSSYTELAHSLYESKKTYHSTCFEFIYKTSTLKAMVDPIISLHLLPSFNELYDLYSENSQIMDGLIKAAKSFHNTWMDRQSEYTSDALLCTFNQWKDDFLPTIKAEHYDPLIRESSTIMLKDTTLSEKEGYLYRKIDQKWTRRYFLLRENHFMQVGPSRSGSSVQEQLSFPVSLCSMRKNNSEDRRFCFDVVSPSDVLTLQAESERELRSWLEALENSQNIASKKKDSGELVAIPSEVSIVDNSEMQLNINFEETRSIRSPEEREEEIAYTDTSLSKKNHELHSLLKSVPLTDYVIEVFSVGLQNDMLIQGRIFLTQNRLCFYSNILGFVNIVVIHMKDIVNLTKKPGTLQTSMVINTSSKSYVFKTYTKQDRCFHVLSMVWKNAISEEPVSTQQLIDSCGFNNKDTSKIIMKNSEEKESEKSKVESCGDLFKDDYKLPESIPLPKSEILCGCKDHLEKVEIDINVPVTAKELYEHMFGAFSQNLWDVLDRENGVLNRKESSWSSELLPSRQFEFSVPANNPMLKTKEVDVKQTDSFLRKDDYLCYVLESKSCTPNVPFGDCFVTCSRYCISWVDESSSRLVISIGVTFLKSTMMKSMIKAAAMKNLSDAAISLSNHIHQKFRKENLDSTSEYSLPTELTAPLEEVLCGCVEHLEKIDVEATIPAPAKHVYELLFGTNSKEFWAELDKKKGIYGRIETPWQDGSKTVNYQLPMNNPMLKAKAIDVNITLKASSIDEYFKYVIDLTAATPQVPYGDCFTNETRYCITWINSNASKLIISNGTTFVKSTMMKSMIKSSCVKASADAAAELFQLLSEKISRKKGATTASIHSTKSEVTAKDGGALHRQNSLGIVKILLSFVLGMGIMHILHRIGNPPTEWNGASSLLHFSKSHRLTSYLNTKFNDNRLSMNQHIGSTADLELETKYEVLQSIKSDLELKKRYVDEMEKHLLWSMYFAWNQREIDTCLMNSTKQCDWSIPEIDVVP
jgi:hypothetical protein